MEVEETQRKVQFQQGSYMITLPRSIVESLGIKKNQYARFAISKKKIIIKMVDDKITKDLDEVERDSAALGEQEPETHTYREELLEALGRNESGGGSSRLEKFRMK